MSGPSGVKSRFRILILILNMGRYNLLGANRKVKFKGVKVQEIVRLHGFSRSIVISEIDGQDI